MAGLLLSGGLLALIIMLVYPRPAIPAQFPRTDPIRDKFERARDRYYRIKMTACGLALLLITLSLEVANRATAQMDGGSSDTSEVTRSGN